jgi:copper chaperone CopZ
MMCGVSCVNKLKAQVDTLEGVKSCDVSFEKGMMTVDYDESKLNDEQIIKLFSNNATYKITTLDAKSSQCSKSCCSKDRPKVGFFKKLFSWF